MNHWQHLSCYFSKNLVLQVACLLLDDPVPNRIHWPRQAELKINSMVYRPYGRNQNTKLGGNARDEPASAAHRCAVGTNRVQLTCVEDRPFCENPSPQPRLRGFVYRPTVALLIACATELGMYWKRQMAYLDQREMFKDSTPVSQIMHNMYLHVQRCTYVHT